MQDLMWLDFKEFLETRYENGWLPNSLIDHCSECKSYRCEHVAKLYLDKLKKSIGFIRDEFSRWLQQNKKIVVASPFKLDFKLITEILKKVNLSSICNDDFLKNYTQWIEDIIHDYVNFDSLISSGPNDNEIFSDIKHFAQEISGFRLNRDNKLKLSFSLIKSLIDCVKHEKLSGFDNIECLSARIISQVLKCNQITNLDDFQALMNFLHTELKIENGTLNAKAIKWISDTIFFEYPVKASKCFDLLRLQSKNNLSPSMLLNFMGTVVNLNSGSPSNYDGANKFITEELNKWGKEERNKFIEEHNLIMDDSNKLYKPKYEYAYSSSSILRDWARPEFNEITDLLSFGENYFLPDPKDLQYNRQVSDFYKILFWVLSNSKEELNAELVQKIVRHVNEHMKIKLPKNIDKYESGKKLNRMLVKECGGLALCVSDGGLGAKVTFNDFVRFKISRFFFMLKIRFSPEMYSRYYAEELIKLINDIRDKFLKLSPDKNNNDKSQLRFNIKVFTEILKQSQQSGYYTKYNEFEDYFKWLGDIIRNDILLPKKVTKTTKKYIADFLEAATDGVDIKDHNMDVSLLKLKSGILDEINKVTALDFSIKDFVSADEYFGDMEFYKPNLDDIKFLFEFIKNNQIDISLEQLNDLLDQSISSAGECFKSDDYQSEAQKAIEYVKYVLNTFEQNMTEIFKSLIQKYKAEQKENNGQKIDWKQVLKFVDNKMLHALGLKISIDENGHVEMQKDLSVIESRFLNKKNCRNCYKAAKGVLMLNGKEGLKHFIQHYPYKEGDRFLKFSSDESKQKFIDVTTNVFFSIVDTESNPTGYSLKQIFDAVKYFIGRDSRGSDKIPKERDKIPDMLRKYYSKNIQCVEKCDESVKKRLCCWIENFWIFDMDAQTKILDAMINAKDGILQANDLEEMDLFLIKHFVFGLEPEEIFATKNKAKKTEGNGWRAVRFEIAFALRKVISGVVHAFVNSKENNKNNKLEITVDDLFVAAGVAEKFYNESANLPSCATVANEGCVRKIVDTYFGFLFKDGIPKFYEKIKNDQIEENVLRMVLAELGNLSESQIKIISSKEKQIDRQFISKKIEDAVMCSVGNKINKMSENLGMDRLKETINSCFKLVFTLEEILSENELETKIKNITDKIYFKLVEIIKNDVNKYFEQIMRDSTGEYDLQKIIDKYCDISKTFSEAGKMSEDDVEETRKNICNAIKNASIDFIENDLIISHDMVKSGQLDKSNLENIQNKYYKMLDTLYRNGTIAEKIVDEWKEAIKNSIEQLKNVAVEQSEHPEKSKISDLKNESEIPAPVEIENETKSDENKNNANEPKDTPVESQKEIYDNTLILKAKVKNISNSDNKANDLESMIQEDIAGIYYENEYHALEKFDVKEKYNKYITKLNGPKILGETTGLKYVDLKNRLDNIFKVNIVFVCFYWLGQVFAFICPGFNSTNAIAGIKNPRTKIIFDRLCYNFCSGVNYLGGQSSFSDKMPIIVKSDDSYDQPNLEEDHSNTRY